MPRRPLPTCLSLTACLLFCLITPVRITAAVIINEFLPDPDTPGDADEWIELYNPTDQAISLAGYILDDIASGGSPEHTLSAQIPGQSYLLFYKEETGVSLNNNGDTVRLLDDQGHLLDSYTYTSTRENWSYARLPDTGPWHHTDHITPGGPNPSLPTPTSPPQLDLALSEIYACPETGSSEWIELYNSAPQSGSVDGYVLQDEAGNTIALSGHISAFAYLAVDLARPILNNTGDSVTLTAPDGRRIGTVSFPACHPLSSFAYLSGEWSTTTAITKGTANRIVVPQSSPTPTSKTQPSPTSSTRSTVTPTKSPDLTSSSPEVDLSPYPHLNDTAPVATHSDLLQSTVAGIISYASRSASPAAHLGPLIARGQNMPFIFLGGLSLLSAAAFPFLKKLHGRSL